MRLADLPQPEAYDLHLTVDLPSISPIHARIWSDLNAATVYDTRAPQGVYVNDDRVEREARIRDGDILWMGAPGEADSVGVQCRFEPWVEVLPGASPADDGTSGTPTGDDAPVAALAEAPATAAPPPASPTPAAPEPPVALLRVTSSGRPEPWPA